MLDIAIHRINHYPADQYWGNCAVDKVDKDLSSG